jgi:hypothetical protein
VAAQFREEKRFCKSITLYIILANFATPKKGLCIANLKKNRAQLHPVFHKTTI